MAPSPRTGSGLIGIDVVDRRDPRCRGKAAHRRFTERVLAPSELRFLASSGDPDRTLWALWAAKEAAFKVVSKGPDGPPPFVHAAFRVELGRPWREGPPEPGRDAHGGSDAHGRSDAEPGRDAGGESDAHGESDAEGARATGPWGDDPSAASRPAPDGRVRWKDRTLHVLVDDDGLRLVAVAWDGEPPMPRGTVWRARPAAAVDPDPAASLEEVSERHLQPAERAAVHSRPSALVRLGARRTAARVLRAPMETLEIVCRGGPAGRTPPRLHLDGRPAPADVSLSHDGDWLAWAVRPAAATVADGPDYIAGR